MSNSESVWKPSAGPAALRARATMLARIRAFFAERNVLEVETPLLGNHTVTDPNLAPIQTAFCSAAKATVKRGLFLQTSPEFAMKRLLASGSGSIYQVCKAFRNNEIGRLHNPEFTLLEWYRVGLRLPELMDETEQLLRDLLAPTQRWLASSRWSYRALFQQHLDIDPITASIPDFALRSQQFDLPEAADLCGESRAIWLDFLFSHVVQPALRGQGLVFVHHFPRCLPSLARVCDSDADAVERVEVFLDGVELGNGFHELADSVEQSDRFSGEITELAARGERREMDARLISALEAGLPDCSGIAIGLDRLLMTITSASRIEEVLAFPIDRA